LIGKEAGMEAGMEALERVLDIINMYRVSWIPEMQSKTGI
jgi:hypothetical protein